MKKELHRLMEDLLVCNDETINTVVNILFMSSNSNSTNSNGYTITNYLELRSLHPFSHVESKFLRVPCNFKLQGHTHTLLKKLVI